MMAIASPLVNGSSRFRAGVCWSTGPGEFYIQTEDSIIQSDFIKKKMQEIYNESALGDEGHTTTVRSNCSTNLENRQIKLCEIHVGSVIAARFSEDDCWYRAEVLSTDIANHRFSAEPGGSSNIPRVQVLFVDYGNKEWVDFNNRQLLQLDASLGINKFPPLAVRCAANVPKLHLWDKKMTTKWSKLMIDRCGTDVDCSWTLRLFDRITGEDLTESITNTVMAESGMSQFPAATPTLLSNPSCAVSNGVNSGPKGVVVGEASLNSQYLECSATGDFEIIDRCDPDLRGNNDANGVTMSSCESSRHESQTKKVAVSENETPASEVSLNEETGVKEYAVNSYPVDSKKSGKTIVPLRKYLAKSGNPNLDFSSKGSEACRISNSKDLKSKINSDIDPVYRYHELQRSAPGIRSPTPPLSDAEDDALVASPSAVAAVVEPPAGDDSFSEQSDDSEVESADRDPEIRRRRNGELRLKEIKRLEKERKEMILATRSATERIQPGTNSRDPFNASSGYDENEGSITVDLPRTPPIRPGSQVHILHADGPANVFVLAAELRQEYQQFVSTLTQVYASNQASNSGSIGSCQLLTSDMVTPGIIAAAEINREWWRVKVMRVHSSRGKAMVRLLDVGKEQEVDMVQLKLLRSQFATSPAFAVGIEVEANCCTLTWSPRTKSALNDYLKRKYGLWGVPLSFAINSYTDSTVTFASQKSSFDSNSLESRSEMEASQNHESRQTIELVPVGTLSIPGTGELVLKEFEEEIKQRVEKKKEQEMLLAAASEPAATGLNSSSATIQTTSNVQPDKGDWALFQDPIPGVIDPATEAGQAILQSMDSQLLEDMACQEGNVDAEESDSYLSDDERKRKERSKRRQIAKQRKKRRAEKELLKFQNANKTVEKPVHRGWESPCPSEQHSTNASNQDNTNQNDLLPAERPSTCQGYENARATESNPVSGNMTKLSSAEGDGESRDRIVVRLLGAPIKLMTVTAPYEIVNVFSPSLIIVRNPVQQRHFESLTMRLKERYDGERCPLPLKRDELQQDYHYVYRYEINRAGDVEWRRVRVKSNDASQISCMLVDFGKRFTLRSTRDCENKFYPLYYPDSVPVLMHRCRLRGITFPEHWSSEIVNKFRRLLPKSIVQMQLHPLESNSITSPSTGAGNCYELEIKQDPLKSVIETWMRDQSFALVSPNKSHESAGYEERLNESSDGFWSASAFDRPLPNERGLLNDRGDSAPILGIDEEDYDEFTDEDDDDEEYDEVVVPQGGPVAVAETVSGCDIMEGRYNGADEYGRAAKVHDWLQSHSGAVSVSPIREAPCREVTSPCFILPLGSSASDQCLARTHSNFNPEISNEKFSDSCSLASFDKKHSTRSRILGNGRGRAIKKMEPELDTSIHVGSEASNLLSSRGHGMIDIYRFRKFPPVVPPPIGVALDVLICHADTPGMFYVQSMEKSQRAKTIHIELNDVFGPPQSLDFRQAPPFELGELERLSSCAAPFPVPKLDKNTGLYLVDDTCNWYRALIKSEDPYGFVVQYVDFGNKDLCSANFLRPLPAAFLFPPQCYMCRLDNVPADLEGALTGPFTSFLLNSIDLRRGGCWLSCTFLKKDPELVYLVRLFLTSKCLDVGEYLMGQI